MADLAATLKMKPAQRFIMNCLAMAGKLSKPPNTANRSSHEINAGQKRYSRHMGRCPPYTAGYGVDTGRSQILFFSSDGRYSGMDASQRAQVFLLLALVCVGFLLVRSLLRQRYSLTQWCLWAVCLFISRILWCVSIPKLNFARDGRGIIFIANHRSSIDPFYFQTRLDRPLHWMVAREFCEHWAFSWFLKQCEVIPVNRGGVDTRSTKKAISLAAAGHWVGMFPEGRINQTDRLMLSVRPGVILTARRAGALIVPCYIHGSPYDKMPWSPFFMPARVRITVGAPIDLSQWATPIDGRFGQQEAGECMREVIRQIAALAGQPDFEPELAGRRWKE